MSIDQSNEWQTLEKFNCKKDIFLRMIFKDTYKYIYVRRFNGERHSRNGVCLNIGDSIELFRKLKESPAGSNATISLRKASVEVRYCSAWTIKGENKVFLSEISRTLVKIYLYAALQMVLIPQLDGQDEFASKLIAGCLAANPFKRSFPGTFGYAGIDMKREDLASEAANIRERPQKMI